MVELFTLQAPNRLQEPARGAGYETPKTVSDGLALLCTRFADIAFYHRMSVANFLAFAYLKAYPHGSVIFPAGCGKPLINWV